jgi:hypothetical protein
MSCQRCGGMLAAELASAMYELVCKKVVIETRYCDCADIDSPVQEGRPRERRGTVTGELPAPTT